MKQLRCADLRPGDLMLKMQAGSHLGRIISLGQRTAGKVNSSLMHARIMFDRNYIIEGEREGIAQGQLTEFVLDPWNDIGTSEPPTATAKCP